MIRIERKEDCCGCTACESSCGHNAIEFVRDEEGFIYPKVNLERCTDCKLCESACPIIYRKENTIKPDYKAIYAARIKDNDILHKSSSGGIFTALAESVLNNDGVVVGATYDNNMTVKHIIIDKTDDLHLLRGSKYSQSDLIGLFRRIRSLLISGKKVLFSGVPCQVEGLKLFLRKKYDNLFTVDIVCHAVPSPKIFGEYIDYINKKYSDKLVWLNMRDKQRHGWNHNFSYRYIFKSGKTKIDPIGLTNWGKLFFSKLIDRPSCHECQFTNYSRPGDITLADLWDDRKLRPELHSKDGTSLLMVNTSKGEQMLSDIVNEISVTEISADEAWQPCLSSPTKANPDREKFWKFYVNNGFEKTYKRFFEESKYIRFKKHIKKLIGRDY